MKGQRSGRTKRFPLEATHLMNTTAEQHESDKPRKTTLVKLISEYDLAE